MLINKCHHFIWGTVLVLSSTRNYLIDDSCNESVLLLIMIWYHSGTIGLGHCHLWHTKCLVLLLDWPWKLKQNRLQVCPVYLPRDNVRATTPWWCVMNCGLISNWIYEIALYWVFAPLFCRSYFRIWSDDSWWSWLLREQNNQEIIQGQHIWKK